MFGPLDTLLDSLPPYQLPAPDPLIHPPPHGPHSWCGVHNIGCSHTHTHKTTRSHIAVRVRAGTHTYVGIVKSKQISKGNAHVCMQIHISGCKTHKACYILVFSLSLSLPLTRPSHPTYCLSLFLCLLVKLQRAGSRILATTHCSSGSV